MEDGVDLKELLREYTVAARDLAVFDAIHKDIMTTRALLEKAAKDRSNELKDAAHKLESADKTFTCVENRYFEVEVQQKESRYYDAEVLEECYCDVHDLKGVITKQADRELVDHYRKLGIIPEDAAAAAECTMPMTPAVRIKQKVKFGLPQTKRKSADKAKEA